MVKVWTLFWVVPLSLPAVALNPPLVKLPYGIFQGKTGDGLTQFLGLPFAQPPVGDLRLAKPVPPLRRTGIQNATVYGPTCPQQQFDDMPYYHPASYNSFAEDCLYINVVKPASAKPTAKLPVLFWIYGGAFAVGGSSDAPMVSLVNRSIIIDQPMVVVAPNYRLHAFGFMAGQEVKNAGLANLGLYDQLLALDWVQQNIHLFGGDPRKVVIGGVSAGATSVADHLLYVGRTKPKTFRGAFLQSGSVRASSIVADQDGQGSYDQIVQEVGCSGSTSPLDCLRGVSFEQLWTAANHTRNIFGYTALNTTWKPRVDGVLLRDNQMRQTLNGDFAQVPLIAGTSDDEGTLYSYSNMNVTTDAQFKEYIWSNYLPKAAEADVDNLLDLYSSDPAEGSPFGTGTNWTLTPQFKRLAAFQGDLAYQGPRRLLLHIASKTQQTWGYINKRGKLLAPVGSRHGSDGPEWYARLNDTGYIGSDALIRFVNTLNPNLRTDRKPIPAQLYWPQYQPAGPLLTFVDLPAAYNFTRDNYRVDAIAHLNKLQLEGKSS